MVLHGGEVVGSGTMLRGRMHQISSSVAALRDGGAVVTGPDPADRRRTLVRAAPEAEQQAATRMSDASIGEAVAAAVDSDDPRVVAEVLAALDVLAQRLLAAPADDVRRPRPGLEGGFDAMYGGTPPWDIGRPQTVFQLADDGAIIGRVLDVGCGTGEHALLAASLGLDAVGVDPAPRGDRGVGAQGRRPWLERPVRGSSTAFARCCGRAAATTCSA